MRSQRLAVLIMLLVVLTGCKSGEPNADAPRESSRRPSARSTGPASGFDFYLLNLSWSPEFCYSHPDAAECATHPGFVLHGLWPENADGTYPEHCSDAPGPADPAAYKDIYPDTGLLEHEWETHGTCSGLSASAFFSGARQAFQSIVIPPRFKAIGSPASVSPDQIVDSFSSSNPAAPNNGFVVSCGHNYLTAIEVCLDKSLHPMACPGAIRSCRARVVRITPP